MYLQLHHSPSASFTKHKLTHPKKVCILNDDEFKFLTLFKLSFKPTDLTRVFVYSLKPIPLMKFVFINAINLCFLINSTLAQESKCYNLKLERVKKTEQSAVQDEIVQHIDWRSTCKLANSLLSINSF